MYTFQEKFCIGSLIKLLYILFHTFGLAESIRGGDNVTNEDFSYQAAVLINNMHACGGAILTSRLVMSGAQCVLDEGGNFINEKFHVIFGVTMYRGWALQERVKVEYIYILFDFRPPNRSNILFPAGLENGDLSILKLGKEIRLEQGTGVSNVDLPTKTQSRYPKYVYETAIVSGFGLLQATIYKSSSDLNNLGYRRNLHGEVKYIEQRVERKDYCRNRYARFHKNVWDNHLCAVSERPNAAGVCFGDVGSPLVIQNQIIGVLQIYNTDCDDRHIPAIYTRVTEYMEFIIDVGDDNFTPKMRLANYTGASVVEIIHPSRRG